MDSALRAEPEVNPIKTTIDVLILVVMDSALRADIQSIMERIKQS